MKIIIAGSRSATQEQVATAIASCPWIGFASSVLSGGARGADSFGEIWARKHDVAVERKDAQWEKHGKRAGPIRNRIMAESADGLIAVWDGRSLGTSNMIEEARRLGLRVTVLRTDLDRVVNYPGNDVLENLWFIAEERAAMKEFSGDIDRVDAERDAGRQIVESDSYRHFRRLRADESGD